MTRWCSLYLPYAAESVVETLKTTLTTQGYQFFNPFGLLPGKTYPQAVRLFVAPARSGWTRIIGDPVPALLPPLSMLAPVLWLELDGADASLRAYASGSPSTPADAFPADADCLRRAALQVAPAKDESLGGVALNALPDDVQALAGNVNMKQAGAMFARLSGNLAPKSGGDPAASDLLRQPEWNSAGGAQITASLGCLGLSGWHTPDFVTLRDAYALHVRRKRTPNATLYPGDAEALAAVPDALAYTPVYAGKN